MSQTRNRAGVTPNDEVLHEEEIQYGSGSAIKEELDEK